MKPTNALEDPRTRAAVYVIEATSHEQHSLWLEHSTEAIKHGWGSAKNQRIEWRQDNPGWVHLVGELAGSPIALELTYANVAGQGIIFWEACTRVVDYEVCKNWLRKNVPAYTENHTNATNFGHCLSYLERLRRTA